ncbi:MAG: TIM barrel protein [Chloroflexota bacterium]
MIYTSTSCLKNPQNIIKVLDEYEKAGIQNVELGSVHNYFQRKKLKKYNFNFIVHGYFPPPKIPFNFNLASQNEIIREKSIKLGKSAIDVCVEIESPIFTFHAGFTVDPMKLGKRFPRTRITDRNIAIDTFVESSHKILDYARSFGIKIAMELNVVQKFNLDYGKNKLLLFADYEETVIFLKKFKKNEIGILLDLGHTSVTSHWLNFDKDEFVEKIKKFVLAVHASNNNGLQDQHKQLTKDCWQISKLKKFKNIPITLETMNLTTNEIKKNIHIAEEAIK